MKKICLKILVIILLGLSILPFAMDGARADTRSDLEAELAQIEAQISSYEKQLAQTKKQKQTLAAVIKKLNDTAARLRLQIKATTLLVKDLDKKISVTAQSIAEKTRRLALLQKQLSSLIKELEHNDRNLFLTLLIAPNFSDFMSDARSYAELADSVKKISRETRQTAAALAKQKEVFSGQQDDAEKLLSIKTLQQQNLLGSLTEQNNLLKETKGQESAYQAALSDSQKRAAQIRNRIYELFAVTKAISFGDAVNIAEGVGRQTGVEAAFLLSVLTQESNLGKNVGTCNRAGDPPEKSWRVIMKPSRDHEPFLSITKNLGLDPDVTPVSCPMKDKYGKQIGWGGAMGPAQFIPSTWLGWQSKIAAFSGKAIPNPWDIRDAFIAAALKLKADGADGTDQGNWRAAMRYFSGSTNPRYRFYGDSVLARAKEYESDIAELGR